MTGFEVKTGDCIEVMRSMESCSFHAVVTDPPAGIGFMDLEWDKSKGGRDAWIAWMQEVARECLRLLKPGGHALVWTIPRTSHWTATAWEDAGFEIRDHVIHLFAGGFPKSMNISLAIDTLDGREISMQRRLEFTSWLRSTGVKASALDRVTNSQAGSHYITQKSQPMIPSREEFEKIRGLLECEVPEWVEELIDSRRNCISESATKRPVVSKARLSDSSKSRLGMPVRKTSRRMVEKTTGYTEAAKRYDGWGTALKPAHENWLLLRKPLDGTVASNALNHDTGGLNIEACRTESRRFPSNAVVSEEGLEFFEPSGVVSKAYLCAKVQPKDRHAGAENLHPTVKPTSLMRWLVRMIARPGQVVLDPFCGSGSTGRGAVLEGCRFLGIEQNEEWAIVARKRIEEACNAGSSKQKSLF